MTEISAISSSDNSGTANAVADHSWSRGDTKTGPNQGVGTMGFDDFLDMINPLEHIPIVSSVYRAITGETINPLARIAGDAMYGGVFGLASAGISALGALGDEIFTASNDGKSAGSTVVAALFGGDDDQTTQLASATPAAAPNDAVAAQPATAAPTPVVQTQLAALQTPARQSPILQMPTDLSSTSTTQVAAATDTAKQPYGGVMDTSMMQNAMQNQALALALVSGHDNMQNQHALRNSRFSTSGASPLTAPTRQSAALPLPGDSPMLSGVSNPNAAVSPTAAINPAQSLAGAQAATPQAMSQGLGRTLPGLAGDLKTMKGLGQYRNAAQSMPVMGASLDMTN